MLAPNLSELLKRHPNIIVDIACEDRPVDFGQHEADIAIRFAWPEESTAVMRRLASIKFRRYHSIVSAPPITPIVKYTDSQAHLPEMQLFSKLRPETTPFLRADRLELLATAAAGITGEVMLPEWMGDDDTRLARTDDDKVFSERPIILLIHPERRKAPSVAAVKEWLYELHNLGAA